MPIDSGECASISIGSILVILGSIARIPQTCAKDILQWVGGVDLLSGSLSQTLFRLSQLTSMRTHKDKGDDSGVPNSSDAGDLKEASSAKLSSRLMSLSFRDRLISKSVSSFFLRAV
jgi:hypothetical protein